MYPNMQCDNGLGTSLDVIMAVVISFYYPFLLNLLNLVSRPLTFSFKLLQ